MISAADVSVQIRPRLNAKGHPFAEVFYQWREGGEQQNAFSRYWHPRRRHASRAHE